MKNGWALLMGLILVGCDSSNPIVGDDPSAFDGEACEEAEDCGSGYCLTELGDPGDPYITFHDGMCSRPCDFDTFEGCLEDELCLRFNATGDADCYVRCDDGLDCRDHYVCLDFTPFDPTDREAACVPEDAI